ncbi:MAG: hypothetical protein ACM3YN_00015 [Parcubacteria group bacterium]
MKLAVLSGLAALALVGAAYAQDAAAPAPAADQTAEAPAPAPAPPAEEAPIPDPVKPYVAECLPDLAPPSTRCGVVGVATLAGAGSDMTWQLYDIAGHGKHSGLSVLFENGQVIDKTEVPADQLQLWAQNPFVMASVLKRDDGNYAVVMVPGDEQPSALSIYRKDGAAWTPISTSGLNAAAQAKLTQVAGPQCSPITSEMSWHAFSLRYGMMSESGTCGTAFLSLGVENNAVVITDAVAVKPDLTPPPRRHRGRRGW